MQLPFPTTFTTDTADLQERFIEREISARCQSIMQPSAQSSPIRKAELCSAVAGSSKKSRSESTSFQYVDNGDRVFYILALFDLYEFKPTLPMERYYAMDVALIERELCESLRVPNRMISKTMSSANIIWKANVDFPNLAPKGCHTCGEEGHTASDCKKHLQIVANNFSVNILDPEEKIYSSYLFREFGCNRFLKCLIRGLEYEKKQYYRLPKFKFFGDGVVFGGRKFEFFCGRVPKSQNNSSIVSVNSKVDLEIYLFATRATVDGALSIENFMSISNLRSYMGLFVCKPAKINERMNLGFSATYPIRPIRASQIELINDIVRNKNILTDGCGFISASFFPNIPANIRSGVPESERSLNSLLPVCIQVRMVCHLGLMKGLLLVTADEALCPPGKIVFRNSMKKSERPPRFHEFDQNEMIFTLDINSTFETHQHVAKLNKDACLLLSDNGNMVPDEVFEDLLENDLYRIQTPLIDIDRRSLYDLIDLDIYKSEDVVIDTLPLIEVRSVAEEGEIDICFSQSQNSTSSMEYNQDYDSGSEDLRRRIDLATNGKKAKNEILLFFLFSGGDVKRDPYFRALVREKQRDRLNQLASCRYLIIYSNMICQPNNK